MKDPVACAKSAGLRYVNDRSEGIARSRKGRGFSYRAANGALVRDRATLSRIAALAIPPAWTRVWICPSESSHIQATGRDERGRKQYRYHARWRAVRDESKFDRVLLFALALPKVRARCESDLARTGLPREKVLATIVRLLEETLIRVGNEEYARDNGSFGLTTLREEHVAVKGSTVRFQFRGKSGVQHVIDLRDRRLARVVIRCQSIPGEELFRYLDEDGEARAIESGDVNDYLRDAAGDDFTAKDFRTWAATLMAARVLHAQQDESATQEAKRQRCNLALAQVAKALGNTAAVCKKSYVHPELLVAFTEGALPSLSAAPRGTRAANALHPDEEAVVLFLQQRSAEQRAAA